MFSQQKEDVDKLFDGETDLRVVTAWLFPEEASGPEEHATKCARR